jgi:hypothetical protein
MPQLSQTLGAPGLLLVPLEILQQGSVNIYHFTISGQTGQKLLNLK